MEALQMTTSKFFPYPLAGRFEDHGRRLVLTRRFVYKDDDLGIKIVVPKDFETDFNSSPRGTWNTFPPWEFPEAGVVHDYIYRHPSGAYGRNKEPKNLSRGECDNLHRRVMHLLGAPWWKRQAMWAALRAGGWKPWKAYRAAELSPPPPVPAVESALPTPPKVIPLPDEVK